METSPKKLREVATYSIGQDILPRLEASAESQQIQRDHLLAAADIIESLMARIQELESRPSA